MRTAAYCRYSSDEQRQSSIRDQLRNIQTYCEKAAWPAPVLFRDEAVSGTRNDRPGYRALIHALESGAFDVVLVDEYSRLSRDHIEAATIVRLLKFRGLRLIGVSDGLDTNRAGYKIETGLRGLMNEAYLDDLAKKTHQGLMGLALTGFSPGGLPYGYRSTGNDEDGYKRHIHEPEAQWVRHIFQRYALGDSPRKIAQALNAQGVASSRGGTWAHTALYPDAKGVGMLGNPMYAGKPVWNRTKWLHHPVSGKRVRSMLPESEWVITNDPALRIIDEDVWQAACARAVSQRHGTSDRKTTTGKGSGGRSPKYLFSSLLRCGSCGAAYVMVDRYQYGCSYNRDRGASVCANNTRVARSTVESVLLDDVRRELLGPAAYAAFEQEAKELLSRDAPDPTQARRALAQARKEAENIMNAIRAGIVTPGTKAALEAAEAGVTAATEALATIERFEPSKVLPRAREVYRGLVDRLESIDDVSGAREALKQLLGGEIRIVLEDGIPYAEMKNAGLAGVCQLTLVAGARFELATFGL